MHTQKCCPLVWHRQVSLTCPRGKHMSPHTPSCSWNPEPLYTEVRPQECRQALLLLAGSFPSWTPPLLHLGPGGVKPQLEAAEILGPGFPAADLGPWHALYWGCWGQRLEPGVKGIDQKENTTGKDSGPPHAGILEQRDGDEPGNKREKVVGKEYSGEAAGRSHKGGLICFCSRKGYSAYFSNRIGHPASSFLASSHACPPTFFSIPIGPAHLGGERHPPYVWRLETETAHWGIEHVSSEATLLWLKSQLCA